MRHVGFKSSMKLCQFKNIAQAEYAVVGAAQAGTRDFFLNHPFDEKHFGNVDSHTIQAHKESSAKLAISHEFDYIATRRKDKNSHSWKLDDAALIKSAYLLHKGLATGQIYLND